MRDRSGTVLVVDPDAPVRLMLQHLLTEAGYRVLACADATECHRLVRAHRPRLALVDVSGRGRDAFWLAVVQLCADPATRRTPLVLMTTNVGWLTEAQAALSALGLRSLPKPFDMVELLMTIEGVTRAAPRRQAPGAPAAATTA